VRFIAGGPARRSLLNRLQLRLLWGQRRRQAGLQPIDLLRLLLDVDAQLVAVLLLELLVAELFGLVHSAIELRNQTLSPTLRQRAFFLGLVLPGYSTLAVWRLNRHCVFWHLHDVAGVYAASRQQTLAQHPTYVPRLCFSKHLARQLPSPSPVVNANLSLSMLLLPLFSLLPLGDTIENEYEKTNSLSRCDIRLTSSCHLWRRTGRIFDASYSAA
jgi:hypothetical protein